MIQAGNNLSPTIRGVGRRLLDLMGGDKEAVQTELEKLTENPHVLEAWADRMYRESVERDIEEDRRKYQEMIENNSGREDGGRIYGFNYDWLSKFQQEEREGLAQRDSFKLTELPGPMRETALAGLAVAYLTDKLQKEADAKEKARRGEREPEAADDAEDVGL